MEIQMRYQLTPIHCRPWTLSYFSHTLIESHYENNYGDALRRLNAITEQLEKLDWPNAPGYVINGLKRDELTALNSTLLHELHFASMGGEGQPTEAMSAVLARDFGSVLRWKDEFCALGYALAGAAGWVALVYLPRDRRLVNQYATEHNQAVAGGIPILALDMYEHAYHMDYGPNAKAYVDTFMRNVDWKALYARYEDAAKVGGLPPMVQPEFADRCFSHKLIKSHYENNYGRALRRLNEITEQLKKLDWANTPGYVINGLKRDELTALNSTLLHQLYFASMGGEGQPTEAMSTVLAQDFGSVLRWKDEFVAMGNALAGGSGWVVLVYLPRDRRLVNQYATEHNQAVAGGIPILALDMYEHAYHMDYGADTKTYVDTFMRNVDWKALYARYEDAAKVGGLPPMVQPEFSDLPSVGVEEVKAMLDTGKRIQVVDTRPRAAVARSHEVMQGATWRDPERVQEWAGELSKSDPVVVYCNYGFHVGCKTAIKLRSLGFDAKFMQGGHSAWKAIGGPVKLHE
jgi:superoxide dismutase, Fe-Mn family